MLGRVRQECELPYPLQKEEGEGEDGWALRDQATGATVLRLRFSLGGAYGRFPSAFFSGCTSFGRPIALIGLLKDCVSSS